MRVTDKYVFFYKDWLSNYQRTNFVFTVGEEKHMFTSTEQAFMYIKAITFGDTKIAEKILASKNPNECRLLGRKVRNYSDHIWSKMRYDIFYSLNLAKYKQDEKLRKKLLDPQFDNKIFVEASPIDTIWGVGLDENNPHIDEELYWRGQNLLGKIITQIRKQLIENGI